VLSENNTSTVSKREIATTSTDFPYLKLSHTFSGKWSPCPQHNSLNLLSNDSMNSFLVGHERAFRIERTLAVLDATEESHLTCNAEQCPVLLALMSRKTTLVQKTEATVTILTEMSGFCCTGTLFNSEIKRRRTVISFQVLKREQIAYKTSELTCHDANLQTSRTKLVEIRENWQCQ